MRRFQPKRKNLFSTELRICLRGDSLTIYIDIIFLEDLFMNYIILPAPKSIDATDGVFSLSGAKAVFCDGLDRRVIKAISNLFGMILPSFTLLFYKNRSSAVFHIFIIKKQPIIISYNSAKIVRIYHFLLAIVFIC